MYIKYIDERASRSVLVGWTPSKTQTDDERETIVKNISWIGIMMKVQQQALITHNKCNLYT